MGFQLDTSGYVEPPYSGPTCAPAIYWSDLTPFAQGYVEALFSSAEHPGYLDVEPGSCDAGHMQVGFRHLDPETLARVIADCEAATVNGGGSQNSSTIGGALFWSRRQGGADRKDGFPPLTVQLGSDGKVRFEDEAE